MAASTYIPKIRLRLILSPLNAEDSVDQRVFAQTRRSQDLPWRRDGDLAWEPPPGNDGSGF
jgi:hypothetical protein